MVVYCGLGLAVGFVLGDICWLINGSVGWVGSSDGIVLDKMWRSVSGSVSSCWRMWRC